MVGIEFDINGDIDDELLFKAMNILGELIVQRVKVNIKNMGLVGFKGGAYLQGWLSRFDGNSLIIENTQEYAIYLEYGTYSYWKQNGESRFTDPMQPKKKDLAADQRDLFPKGMQSFAPLRKVLYNQNIMGDLITKAFELAAV